MYVTVNSSEPSQATVPLAALTVNAALSEAIVYAKSLVPLFDNETVAVFVAPIKTLPKARDEAVRDATGVEGYTMAGPVMSST